MATAFQPSAFQPTAFQQFGGTAATVRYVIGNGSAINGNGLFPTAAVAPGGDGAYISPPSNSFSSDIEWRMVAGNTLDMGATGLTTGNNVVIVKYGSGADFIINGTNSILLNSSTAANVSISDLQLIRTGGVSGTGYNAGQTNGTTLTRCTITGSQINVNGNDAVSLTIADCTLGASSTEYGLRTTAATTTCSDWSITGTAFNGGVGIELQASNAANAAGRYTGLVIDGNTFTNNLGSSIVMQSVLNLTDYFNNIEVTSTTTIVRNSGATPFPAWTAGQQIFLAGFSSPTNFGLRTVVSVVGDTLTVSGAALAVEGDGEGKGIFLRDANRAFISPEIANNVCTGNGETPMLLASISGGRIHHNTITNGTATSSDAFAAAIEMAGFWSGTVVDYNTIDNISLGATQTVDGAGIFTDGACDGVIVRNNTISNIYGRAGSDNSGMGTAFFYATGCTHENNTITNCYRGTWAGGTGGTGNVIQNNSYTDSDYGIFINCSVPIGTFDYLSGHTFDNNIIDIYSCPDGFTQQGTPRRRRNDAGSPRRSRQKKKYVARYKGEYVDFSTLQELEDFVASIKEIEKEVPKKVRAPIKITLSPDFIEEITPVMDYPRRLDSMPTGAAMAQIRKLDLTLAKLLADAQRAADEEDEELCLLCLLS